MSQSKVEILNFNSNILGKEMKVFVYLPEGYDNLTPLSVLYFLHGRSGNENIMFELDIKSKADKMIRNREINPMIIVCPRMENSRGLNSSLICKEVINIKDNRVINLGMYEDYFMKEIIPLIDKSFNTINDRKQRFIGGASAGGYIALHNAFRHQNIFSKVGGHMPALELKLEDEDKIYYNDLAVWDKYDPIYIAKNNDILNDMDIYLDAGDRDEGRFYEGCLELHELLKEKGINSQNHIFYGNHSAKYIESNLEKYLKFYGC
ncbi:alpha/beta hydrolase [Paraclostridium sordellii]|uniref:alpha/beta hydrolase n=1 Tax=Paraclostridium sordellii TaxID=1505 RepID=UPI00189B43C1|nr:alpha/beta hydrolase-fold protein [Paeniclostridium sordellii]